MQIKKICTKYSLERIPRNHEILATVNGHEYSRLQRILLKKPVKTASGVAVIALMPMPYTCPHGRCTYCPGGIEFNSPNSYTGNEPSTINAIENQYDPKRQILSKIEKLTAYGHDPTKMEIVIVGGTFLFMPRDYQLNFIKACYDALNGIESQNLEEAKAYNENAHIRNVGFTIETKPDYCKQEHVDVMLQYGITRVEIGVQSLQENVYRLVNRGHTYSDVTESFQVSKDSGYKIVAHMMPGLPTMTPEGDITDFKRLFSDDALKPDMLKIYPSLVLPHTPLYQQYLQEKYKPHSDEDMIRVLIEVKKCIPRWMRIMRVQREISPQEIIAGPKSGNLRQIVHERLKKQNISCCCIRCREIGLGPQKEPVLHRQDYTSSGGDEIFLSYDDSDDKIYGFLRLRNPSQKAHREEIVGSCIVRELHVYGRSLKIGEHLNDQIQHSGLGKNLMHEAEKIASEEFDAKKLVVISAVGTRQYYRKLGYSSDGPYMAKLLPK
jgi:elongator complex protein 3